MRSVDAKELIKARKQAEKAVEDMPEGELKVKAFEVILGHLLPGEAEPSSTALSVESKKRKSGPSVRGKGPMTLTGRILVLRDEAYFSGQRGIGEVRDELSAHGWHYPLSTLSGSLQALVRARELRRQKTKLGNKIVWKYSNP
jgi:hypothetical protein